MPVAQFVNSLRRILGNPHINRPKALLRHFMWQLRKILNLFPFTLRVSESMLVARNKACGVAALVNAQGLYDYNNMNLVKDLLNTHCQTFMDIGANIGIYSLLASEQPQAEVFAFEPHPDTCAALVDNLSMNNRPRAKAFNLALGNSNAPLTFTDMPGSSVNKVVENENPNTHTIQVECVRADAFCLRQGFLPEVVKIDVEGFEYQVLEGFGDLLSKVSILLIETDRSKPVARQADEVLRSAGHSGPYTYVHATREFCAGSPAFEDEIFISQSFKTALSQAGYRFPQPTVG